MARSGGNTVVKSIVFVVSSFELTKFAMLKVICCSSTKVTVSGVKLQFIYNLKP